MILSSIEGWSPRKKALCLLGLGLAKALIIALIVTPSYGADGAGYLQYVDAFVDPTITDAFWIIRGTTPIYPFFAYSAYLFGLGSGYTIALAQIMLGGLVAPAVYLALRPFEERAALLAGLFLALDPQMGLLNQLAATDALYGTLLGLSMAAFFWNVRSVPSTQAALGLGLLLGVSSFVRPIGMFLLAPYMFFYACLTRSLRRCAALAAGYALIFLLLSVINLWRFDFFAPNNTNGFYLATRLFGVGGLYDRANGSASEHLYELADDCGLRLTDEADAETLGISQNLRLCLFYEHAMTLDEMSRLYQQVYSEAVRTKPIAYGISIARQVVDYALQPSDAYDLAGVQKLAADCENAPDDGGWYESYEMFCPPLPTPLAFLDEAAFWGMFGFNGLTRVINFLLAAVIFWRSPAAVKWLLLFCLGLYAYHALATAAAGTILSRYVTVTNTYLLVTLAFALVGFYDHYWRKMAKSSAI